MTPLPEQVRRAGYEVSRWVRDERLARRVAVHSNPGFILGMQKSGTSAVAALLSLRTGTPVAIDLAREWRRCTIVRASYTLESSRKARAQRRCGRWRLPGDARRRGARLRW